MVLRQGLREQDMEKGRISEISNGFGILAAIECIDSSTLSSQHVFTAQTCSIYAEILAILLCVDL